MKYTIIDDNTGKGIEHHDKPFAAQRALHILSAHELKNGRNANFRIDPPIIEVAPPTLDELNLPTWAYNELTEATAFVAGDDK